jgi:hypothetical protein
VRAAEIPPGALTDEEGETRVWTYWSVPWLAFEDSTSVTPPMTMATRCDPERPLAESSSLTRSLAAAALTPYCCSWKVLVPPESTL